MSLIEVEDLTFKYVGRRRPALRQVGVRLARGESLLVLGPSGCGKSTFALCLNGAIPQFIEGDLQGRVRVGGLDTRHASMAVLSQRVGIVFQDPETQFCMLTLEEEVAFGLENLAVPRSEMGARIAEALEWVGLADRQRDRIERLSGGQKQRLALACVLAQRAEVLVFDEPTAQLDPVGVADVVALLERLRADGRHTLVIIEHRLDDLMHLIDRTLVLSSEGEMVADGPPRHVMAQWGSWLSEAGVWVPQVSELATALGDAGVPVEPMPLTVAEAAVALRPLASRLAAAPVSEPRVPTPQGAPLIEVDGLSYRYSRTDGQALDGVRLQLWPGQLAAIVGANGAGKSTLARHLVRIVTPPPGRVKLHGTDLSRLRLSDVTSQVGYVFQYPEHQFVGQTLVDDVAFGLRRAGVPQPEAHDRAQAMLDEFGLGHLAQAHPYSISHGEQRRLSVAAMLVLGQIGLFLDEPTFGQDRRNAQLLLEKLQELASRGRAIVAITHDMRLVAESADRVLVMVDGRIELDGRPRQLFSDLGLMRRARLGPPPLWRLSRALELPSPFVRIQDVLVACRAIESVPLS